MRLKRKYVRKKSIPFLILAVIHLGLFGTLTIMNRKKHQRVWVLLLSNIGFAYLFEYFVLNVFHGYRYKPSLMKRNFFDAVLGAILSQGVYVPIAATLLTLFRKGWKWKLGISFLYFYIELLFLRLNVYKVYWWKPYYTPVLLNFYFFISDRFYRAILLQKRWALAIANYLSHEVIWVTLMFIYAYRKQIRFGRGRFHTWSEHFIIVPLYSLALSFIATLTSSKSGWGYRLIVPFVHILIDTVLTAAGLLKLNLKRSIQHIPRYTIMTFVSRLLFILVYKKPLIEHNAKK